ncbi:MAG: hypothetical protein SWO11_14055, partial [Thermodesulfobacteriota bacterium]|nr:hypothetical protein [Thermodesulfobacteriota bacterium]
PPPPPARRPPAPPPPPPPPPPLYPFVDRSKAEANKRIFDPRAISALGSGVIINNYTIFRLSIYMNTKKE